MQFLLLDICKGKPSEVSDDDDKLVDNIETYLIKSLPNSFKHSPYKGARLISVPDEYSFNTMVILAQIIPSFPQVNICWFTPKVVCGLLQYSL